MRHRRKVLKCTRRDGHQGKKKWLTSDRGMEVSSSKKRRGRLNVPTGWWVEGKVVDGSLWMFS